MELWQSILSCVAEQVSPHNFEVWFRPTSLCRQDLQERKLFVRVPNKHFKHWLAEKYREVIDNSLRQLKLDNFQVLFLTDDNDEPQSSQGPGYLSMSLKVACEEGPACNLNSKYTFSSFVVGTCNQFAHAAALAVANRPSRTYNPFFLYGGVGLGKTHLMQAIGHCLKSCMPRLRLTYMSSERFMNELINSIRYNNTPQFRQKYRNIDVLLLDDVQFFAGKERTQEEFFHTFNALYDAHKQIVISCDCPPREIPTLEERLHSRFHWGLIVDIQPPDLNTKMAILRKKAEAESILLPDEVTHFIASNIRSNIRELEGSLVRLVAYSSLTGEPISLKLAMRVLRSITASANHAITVEAIQKIVAHHFSLKTSDLKAKDSSRRVAEPRQLAMYLAKQLTPCSLPQIGREFGGKHHTTVLHSVRKIQKLRSHNPRINSILNKLTSLIQRT